MSKPWNKEQDQSFRQRYRRLPELILLGLGTGLITALLIVLFRWLLELPEILLAGFTNTASLAELPSHWRFIIPLSGAVLLWAYWRRQPSDSRRVGITHIHERLSHHHGDLPMRNLINQLIGAALSLGTGQPVGREGPAVHLGAALSSWLGSRLGLPSSMQRLLVGCGSAAAIAALFNLPLAGILFAMEVVLLGYNLIGFTAIIISAVSADFVTQMILGKPESIILVTDQLALYLELPLLLLLSLLIASGGWIFQQTQIFCVGLTQLSLSSRLLIAGTLVGLVAQIFPEVLTPVHTVTLDTLSGNLALSQLFGYTLVYLCLTPIVLGLGIPGGVIGPALALGALLGALISWLFNVLGATTELSVYALIGMAAMMSAVIHAPLAALIAVFELSSDTHTLGAAMLVIVGSDLIMRAGFGKPSIFERLLASQGLSLNTRLFRRVMMSTNVQEVIRRSLIQFNPNSHKISFRLQVAQVEWVVRQKDQNFFLLKGGRLDQTSEMKDIEAWKDEIDSEELPWSAVRTLSSKASLLQALELMAEAKSNIVLVVKRGKPIGLLTEGDIRRFFQERAE